LDHQVRKKIYHLIHLLQVVDDFIGMMQAPTHKELEHFTHAIIQGIHTEFPPPSPSDNPEDKPILIKKVKQVMVVGY